MIFLVINANSLSRQAFAYTHLSLQMLLKVIPLVGNFLLGTQNKKPLILVPADLVSPDSTSEREHLFIAAKDHNIFPSYLSLTEAAIANYRNKVEFP